MEATAQATPEGGATYDLDEVRVPKTFAQLGVLVVDGSGSMKGPGGVGLTKAQATNNAVRELFTRFKRSKNAKNFAFSVVTFDHKAKVRMQPTPALDLNDNDDYNPLAGHGGETSIHAALEEAEKVAATFLAAAPDGGVPHSAVILVMSDGECDDPVRTRAVADRIKNGPQGQQTKIACAFFSTIGAGTAKGEGLLKEIASDPVMGYKTVYGAEDLRDFFTASISAASGGVTIG
jgi:uncharacterized protein YegL